MVDEENASFYRRREQQELTASEMATDATIKRLHWEMAQRYAFLAAEAEGQFHSQSEAEELSGMPSDSPAF